MSTLDVQEFDHPVPLEMTIDAFKKLTGSEVLLMIHRREPIPLFEIITKNGGFYRSMQVNENLWHIFITRDPTLDLGECRV
ncbi:MAG: DUF2249 domain-containing protein [Campylobacterales bacterium]|nr:DUF2249 domain-containing protein [Campylobacterales bacterium]